MCSKFCNKLGLNKSITNADNDDDNVRLNCSSGITTASVFRQHPKDTEMAEANMDIKATEDHSPTPMVQETDFVDPKAKEDVAAAKKPSAEGPSSAPSAAERDATAS